MAFLFAVALVLLYIIFTGIGWIGVQRYAIGVVVTILEVFQVFCQAEGRPRFDIGWVCHENHLLVVDWVGKFQPVRPQGQIGTLLYVATVAHVAVDGATYCVHLYAYLVAATSAQLHLDKGNLFTCFQHFVG